MTDFFTILIFIGLAIVFIGRSQRRKRSRQLARTEMEAANHIYRSEPRPALDRQGDESASVTDTANLRSTTTAQVANVLSQVLGTTALPREAITGSTPDPTWEPPTWSPSEMEGGMDPSEPVAESSVGDRPAAASDPLFADLDPADTPRAVTDALRNPDLRSAERALRNASLNGVDGADIALGLLMFRAGRHDEAEGVFRNAARTHGVAANNLGVVLENDGRGREAVVFYQKAAALGNETALHNLKRLEV